MQLQVKIPTMMKGNLERRSQKQMIVGALPLDGVHSFLL
jgi:hypothetical protein